MSKCKMLGAAFAAAALCASARGAELTCYAGSNAGSSAPLAEREAIRTLAVDSETGAVREKWLLKGMENTTYFALAKDGKRLYTFAAGPKSTWGPPGFLLCFRTAGDALEEEWRLELPCEAPCHLSLSPDGKTLAFAAYGSATAGTVDIATKRVRTVTHTGRGPNAERQEKAHAHCAFFTPAGDRVGVVDLGIDQVRFYDLEMRPDEEMTITVAPGLGPRHVAFSPDGKLMFLVHELGNALSSYAFDGRRFTFVETKSTIPPGFKDFSKAAAVRVSADGRLVMASNRGHDSIAFFAVDPATGRMTLRNIAKLKGRFPRDFAFVPGEKFMIVGHKMSDEIQMYRFDRAACALEPVGAPLKAYRPLCFTFAP